MSPQGIDFFKRWATNTVAVLVAAHVVPGIDYEHSQWVGLLLATLVLGILNTFLRPVLILLSLPLVIFTLGLFMVVINAGLLCLVAWMFKSFHVANFSSALLGAIIISVVSALLNLITGNKRSRIQVRYRRQRGRRRPAQKPSDHDDQGPIIDV